MDKYGKELLAEAEKMREEFEQFKNRVNSLNNQELLTHDEMLKTFIFVELARLRLMSTTTL